MVAATHVDSGFHEGESGSVLSDQGHRRETPARLFFGTADARRMGQGNRATQQSETWVWGIMLSPCSHVVLTGTLLTYVLCTERANAVVSTLLSMMISVIVSNRKGLTG
jgi:hypothetical protein